MSAIIDDLSRGHPLLTTPEMFAQGQTRRFDYVCVTSAYLPITAV